MIIALLSCAAQGPVEQGATAFKAGKLDEAITTWSEIERSGRRPSGVTSYNLGVAWYRKGDPARAIASLRAAQSLRPRDSNIHHNLALARAELGIVPTPVSDPGWTQVFTPGEAGVSGALCAAVASLGALVGGLLRKIRGFSDPTGGHPLIWPVLLSIGLLLGLLGLWETTQREQHPVAVIVGGEAAVRDAADINAGERFRFPVGTEARVQRTRGDFLLLEDSRARRGWVARSAVVLAR